MLVTRVVTGTTLKRNLTEILKKGGNFIRQLFTLFVLLFPVHSYPRAFLLCSRGERRGDTPVVRCAGDVESADEAWLLN